MDTATLEPGLRIPSFTREGTLMHWNRFAGVNDEYAGHHMDDDVGRYEGFDSAFGMAPLTFSYLQAMLRDWLAGEGRIVSLQIRLRSPFLRGKTMTAGGEIRSIRKEDDETVVELEVWADNNDGVRMVLGEATVAFPRSGGPAGRVAAARD